MERLVIDILIFGGGSFCGLLIVIFDIIEHIDGKKQNLKR